MINTQQELDRLLSTSRDKGIPTGIRELDEFTYGFRPGNLIILGGVSSSGKTSLMTDFILAASEHVGVGVFSIEMGDEVVRRAVYNLADLNFHRCQNKRTKSEEERFQRAIVQYKKLHSVYMDSTAFTLYPDWRLSREVPSNSMEGAMDRMYQAGARIFFIDYVQLLQWGNKIESEALRLKEITGKLHALSLKYKVPIIALSQLTKATADRATKKDMDPTPTLSDLRDSGFLVNDADIILLLHRPEYYRKKQAGMELLADTSESAQIIIGKQRSGPTGMVEVTFRAYCMSFRDTEEIKDGLF